MSVSAQLLLCILSLGLLPSCLGRADELQLGSPFGDHMVLQRDRRIPIWGWSAPNSSVRVSVTGREPSTVVTGETGKWTVVLDPIPVGAPVEIAIRGDESEIILRDVVAGEVWLCSGQSNMEWPVAASANATQEMAGADFPLIRQLNLQHQISMEPQDRCPHSGWQVCTPQTVGQFTAVGYYFGRQLHRELNVPIGLINSSWGGTIIEAWTSAASLRRHIDFSERIGQIETAAGDVDAAKEVYRQAFDRWQSAFREALGRSDGLAGDVDDSHWDVLQAPGVWEAQGHAGFDGIAWLRRSVRVPKSWQGQELRLALGQIDDHDRTFVNGFLVGETEGYNRERVYTIPQEVNSRQTLTVAVQIRDTGGSGGFHGAADSMSVGIDAGDSLSLIGEWKFKTSTRLSELPAPPTAPGFDGPNNPTALYNGMIHPLVPYGIRGAIWYQGEANVNRAYQYRELFPLLIHDWRAKWDSEFSFYWVQLANFMAPANSPQASAWAELREAQSVTLREPKTGQAVIIDIGEADDIHPRNKQDVGRRLANLALRRDYGRDVQDSGPIYRAMRIDGNKIRLDFEHAEGLTTANGKPLTQFAIAGANRKFFWAQATIDGEHVVVSADNVLQPLAVRYAWSDNPVGCNLTNSSGLPASPFRTDDWPESTFNNR